MPRWVKVVIWIGVFTFCAGAGALVAAHTNPFPPGVEDPGARPTTPPPTSPTSTEQRWNLDMSSATRHELHVGGSCRSGWRTTGVVTIHPNGTVTGEATAELNGWGCDFPVAQVQTRSVRISISGTYTNQSLELRFEQESISPPGSQDLGGFTKTLPRIAPGFELVALHSKTPISVELPDGDLGRYVAEGGISLRCSACSILSGLP